MNAVLLDKLKEKKRLLLKDGFEIIGVFGSYARGNETKVCSKGYRLCLNQKRN